jgi:hypothetical protein
MPDFGGQIRFTYDGTPIRIRARVELEPGDFQYTAEHNQDGSFARYVQPMGPVFDLEFEDSVDGTNPTSLKWAVIMLNGPYNISILEDTNGIIHTIANGQFVGRPKIDRLKGVVTGIQIQGAVGSYQQLTA